MERNNSLRSSPEEEDELKIANKPMKAIQEMKPQPEASCKHRNTKGGGGGEEDKSGFGFAKWAPQRAAYTCGFCKRQFRCAQALGGHMNVHRRDRAKLRRSPPITDSNNGSSSPPPIKFLKLSHFSTFSTQQEEESDGGSNILNKVTTLVRMEKDIGFVGTSNDIDLELKLGF